MGEILGNWIRARSGILIDLTPDAFGHCTRDGRLLAEIMHSYDAISRGQLDTIARTRDPALCRVNLKHLKVWLRFVGVELDDESIEEISCGKGTASLRLFYKLYLCLETKDRLHFVTLRDERENYAPTSKKFEVSRVCEKPAPYQPPEHPLSKKLIKGREAVEWARPRFSRGSRDVWRERECPEARTSSPVEERESADRFASEQRRPLRGTPRTGRRRRAAVASALRADERRAVFSELWERIADRQEEDIDRAIAARALDQPEYEKRMLTKLREVREQKNAMAENRKMFEDATLEAMEVEHRCDYELAKDLESNERKNAETECRRMCELRQRLLAAKVRGIRERHRMICRRVIEDAATIASNVADHRRLNEGRVPSSLLAEWNSLFVRCLPIFAEEPPPEPVPDDQSIRRAFKSLADPDSEALESLRDALFDDYLERNPPWNEPEDARDEDAIETSKLGRLVLGYVAHRLLDHLYPRPPNRAHALLRESRNVVLVLGVGNSSVVRESIETLLAESGTRSIRMEDAINLCLERYKAEMSEFEYVDAGIAAVAVEPVRGLEREATTAAAAAAAAGPVETSTASSGKNRDRRRKWSTIADGDANTRVKQTQTPRNIPYDDLHPVLTDAAYMGKLAYEFLTLGEPIPDELATKILIEHLTEHLTESTDARTGIALFDYPATYEQMRLLEAALTGRSPPADPRAAADLSRLTIEDIEDAPPRIAFEDESDPFAAQRRSRLVPDPIATRDPPVSNRPFVTLFVRVARQPKHFERGERTYETVAEDASPIDRYYASRGIARILYYDTFDVPTLKTLARLAMGEASRRKLSDELFGDAPKSLERDARRGPSAKQAVVRRLLTEDQAPCDDHDDDDVAEEEEEEEEEQQEVDGNASIDEFPLEIEPRPARPGTPDWRWIDFPLPLPLFESLAKLWEGIEGIYAHELRELLLIKSLHASSVAPYVELVTRNAREFVERPDDRQCLLRRFRAAFDALDPDARNDAEVKCELHRRLADFEAELWRICDERRRIAEDERRRYVDRDWTLREAILLFDAYTGIVQAETDRFVDTIRLLQDYYLGMLRKPLQDTTTSKPTFRGIDPTTSLAAEENVRPSSSPSATDRRRREPARTPDASNEPAAALDVELARKEIRDALIDDVDASLPLDAILTNARHARTVVDAISLATRDLIARTSTGPIDGESAAAREVDATTEWRYAVAYETDRVRGQLDAIVAVARRDVAFLLDATRTAFREIREFVMDRYRRETRSANEAADAFRFAIEEGTTLEAETLLDGDRFVALPGVPATESIEFGPTERAEGTRFRVARLARLLDTFRRIAPSGTIGERAFVYVLQDLTSHGREEGETMDLPCSWYRLRPSDVPELVAGLFGRVDEIEWREFLVYALDLPMPTCRELLIARERFRVQDPELSELVTRDQFRRTPIWFLDRAANVGCPGIRSILADDEFHRNSDELFEEEQQEEEEEQQQLDRSVGDDGSTTKDARIYPDQEILRRVLAKELLCRMYAVDRRSVNYTAFLLAFCKHRDPRVGFGKALALALGSRVCIDPDDGERYAAELRIRRPSYLGLTEQRSFAAGSDIVDDEEMAGEETTRDVWRERDTVVHWISLDLCLTVLAATLPRIASRPDLVGPSLRDALVPVFRELEDPELDHRKNVALAHRLLRHPFFDRLFASVSNFTAVDAGSVVLEILRAGRGEKSDRPSSSAACAVLLGCGERGG